MMFTLDHRGPIQVHTLIAVTSEKRIVTSKRCAPLEDWCTTIVTATFYTAALRQRGQELCS
ncbi:hypothetical protein ACVJGD_008632 [Bradyrhizobium sp. USDA 10063]